MNDRWWWRPLRAVAIGVAIGLGFVWLISGLSGLDQAWVILAVLVVMMAFCIWQLIDLRRLQRDHAAKVAEWRRQAGEDWQ